MQEVTFTLQTITPLFLAGGEQKRVKVPKSKQTFQGWQIPSYIDDYAWQYKAELRVPSFRGLMGYWQRALVGGMAKRNVDRLRLVTEAEDQVFGSTDKGSTIYVRISEPIEEEPKDFIEPISKNTNGQWYATGKGYLLWSMSDSSRPKEDKFLNSTNTAFSTAVTQTTTQGKETEYKPPRQYFRIGSTFSITLSTRGQTEEGKVALQKAVTVFWLLVNLGGIGSRSRRCAGSITVTRVKGNLTSLPFNQSGDAAELQTELSKGIQFARNLWSVEGISSQGVLEEATFDIISIPSSCRIWVLRQNDKRPWDSAEDAMRDMGEKLQAYRSSISSYKKRSIFGLPLIVKSLQDKALQKELKENRMSSPLLLHITQLQGGKYVGVAVLFKTKLDIINMSDYGLIEQWIKQDFPDALEVQL